MVVQLERVSKRFGTLNVLTDVTARFESGRVHCITGENGSGKTTLLNLMGGQSDPDSGRILYGGKAFARPNSAALARLGVARLFQQIRLFEEMSALENVLVGFKQQLGESVSRSLLAPRLLAAERASLRERALSLLADFGMRSFAQQVTGTLSLGQSKMVALARLAAGQPRVLLLDEPTAGLSLANRRVLLRWLTAEKAGGACIIVIEHGDAIASEIGDRFYHLHEGQLIEA